MDNAPRVTLSARTVALKLSQTHYAISADDVSRAAGCSLNTAEIELDKLRRDGLLFSLATGYYGAKPEEHKPTRRGTFIAIAKGERKSKAVELAEVEAWLTSKEQFPGATSPLPLHRTPNFAPARRVVQ